jgi:LPPG:FO 2-phospho-L-lactate transferase
MTTTPSPTITVLSGGVGAARFLRGLLSVVDAADVTAIVNTGDDTTLHGLSISPDLDTITYTLAGAIDPERGWGLAGETWQAMGALARYAVVRPEGSAAGTTWFNLGDRDLATHLYRTARMAEGASPTVVADEVRRAWGLSCDCCR